MNRLIQVSDTIYLKLHYEDITESDGLAISFDINTKWRVNGGSWNTETQEQVILTISGIGVIDIEIGDNDISLRSGDYVEIVGSVFDIENLVTPAKNIYWNQLSNMAVLNPIEIILYRITDKDNKVSKTLLNPTSFYGAVRDEINVLNPVIILDIDLSVIIDKNYAYIPSLKRYYFINDYTCVRTGIYRINFKVDVLKSYSELIHFSDAIVTRASYDDGGDTIFDDKLVDDRLPLKDTLQTDYKAVPYGTLVDTNLSSYVSEPFSTINSYRFIALSVVDTYNVRNNWESDAIYTAPNGMTGVTQYISPKLGDNPLSSNYALNYSDFIALTKKLKDTSSLASYVISAVAFPYNLNNAIDGITISGSDIYRDLYVNNTLITETIGTLTNTPHPRLLKGESSGFHVIADTTIDVNLFNNMLDEDGYRFLNYEPYSYYDMFIPYAGWVKLNSIDIVNYRIIVYFIADFVTGLATANVYNYTKRKLIYTTQIQLGIPLGLTRTNIEEITKQRQANISNLMLGLISSGVGTAIGVATLNPTAIAGGVLGAGATIMNAINKNAMMIERASCNTGGDKFGLYSGEYVIIKHTYRQPIITSSNETAYRELNGYPINDVADSNKPLGDYYQGYTELADIYLQTSYTSGSITYTPTKEERDEIKSLVKIGVIL